MDCEDTNEAAGAGSPNTWEFENIALCMNDENVEILDNKSYRKIELSHSSARWIALKILQNG